MAGSPYRAALAKQVFIVGNIAPSHILTIRGVLVGQEMCPRSERQRPVFLVLPSLRMKIKNKKTETGGVPYGCTKSSRATHTRLRTRLRGKQCKRGSVSKNVLIR
jgi:hypothetical protein